MYGPSQFAGELGGLLTIVKIVCAALVGWGGVARLEAVITERLYKDSNLHNDKVDDQKRLDNPEKYFYEFFKKKLQFTKDKKEAKKSSSRIRPPFLWEW